MATITRLDKETREAIIEQIAKSAQEQMEKYKEEWLTCEELCQRLPMFTVDWVRHHGSQLPRERLEMEDAEGNVRYAGKRWMYPLHRIMRDIAERKHKHFRYEA